MGAWDTILAYLFSQSNKINIEDNIFPVLKKKKIRSMWDLIGFIE